jgi:acetamidase/formamidase
MDPVVCPLVLMALEDAGIKPPGPNPLTGPFYIEGAEPGDTLAIHFLAVEVNANARIA